MFGNLKELPKPLGDFAVGFMETEFTDTARTGIFAFAKDEAREVPVAIYYPCTPGGEPKAGYTVAAAAEFWSKRSLGLVSKKIADVTMPCYVDAPVSDRQSRYPVIFYNHGYFSYMTQNSVLCADLASMGYIVVSVGHPHEACAVRFSDGRVVGHEESLVQAFQKTMDAKSKKLFYKGIMKQTYTDEQLLHVLTDFYARFKGTAVWEHVQIWADDNRFVADRLKAADNPKFAALFAGKLALEKGIGITGHSYGGDTATQVCLSDDRFVCGVNIDAPTYGDYWDQDVRKPFLVFGSDVINYAARSTFTLNSEDSYLTVLADTKHMDFTDYIFITRQSKLLGLIGKRDPGFLRETLSRFHIQFFDKYLKNLDGIDLTKLKYDGLTTRFKPKKQTI